MGSEESKTHVEHNGSQHVEIVNMQEQHSNMLEENKLLLWLILGVVSLQLVLTLVDTVKKHIHKRAMRKIDSMINLKNITVQK